MRKLIFALALGAVLLPNLGFTLGLGDIEVSSSLNQELNARIDLLTEANEDVDSLVIKLASEEEFIRAGLDRPFDLTALKFKTSVEGDQAFISVTSSETIREPFLNFLVEVDWPKGHLLREYTVLLDPPAFMQLRARQAQQQADVAAQIRVESSGQVSGGVAAFDLELESTDENYTSSDYSASQDHRVQSGDTAWSIANKLQASDDSVSTQQMLIAMLRANPEAFINENVNGLKRGFILRTPDYEDATAISHEEAKDAVREQNALWHEYQQSLASDQPASAIDEDYSESEYSSDAEMTDDSRLSIVSAGGDSSASGVTKDSSEMSADELNDQLTLAREQLESERVEKEGLQSQVDSMSDQVSESTGLLDIEDDAMAEIQSAAADDEITSEEVSDLEDEVFEQDTTDLDSESEVMDALDELTDESADEVSVDEEDELFTDEADQVVEEELLDDQEMVDPSAPVSEAQPEVGLVDSLFNNPMIVGGILILMLVVGALVYIFLRRRANAANESDVLPLQTEVEIDLLTSEEDSLEDIADMIDEESMDELAETEEAEVPAEKEPDLDATMILPSESDTVVTPAASLQPEGEQDDVLAEADVYLAYGIYQQAEEVLVNAIAEHPDKDLYRVKLAEIYFASKDAEALSKMAVKMKQKVGNEASPAWDKIAAMGKELCPDDELFQQADSADLDVNAIMPKSPEPMDFDLGAEEEVGELDLDFDAPLDEGNLELPSSEESLDELEFDLSETDAVEESETEEEFSLDIGDSELDMDAPTETEEDAGMELDLDMSMSMDDEPEAEEVVAESAELDELDLGMDLDMSMGDTASDTDEAGEFDLSEEVADDAELDISMDELDLSEPVAEEVSPDLSMDEDLGDIDLSEPVDAEEMNTKLDLAKAYQDMGDNEGAREILEEVVAGGTAGQKKEASELMAKLD